MYNNTSCAETMSILEPAYGYMIIAECVVAWLAIPPNLILIIVIWHVTVFSQNLRLLMAHFSFVLLWFSIGTIVKSLYTFASFNCAYSMSLRNCKLFELGTTGLVLANILYSFLALCAQRLHAALMYKKYDMMTQQRPWLALGLITGSWIIVFTVNCRDIWQLPSDWYLPICASTFLPLTSSTTFILYLIFEMLATMTVVFVYFYTKHINRNMSINRALFDLSSRFQVDQNVRINVVVVPSLLLHILCHIPTFILLSGLAIDSRLNFESKPWLTRITYLMRLVYAFIHPILAFSLNSSMRNHLMDVRIGSIIAHLVAKCQKKTHTTGVATVVEHIPNIQSTHFNYLDKVWADQERRTSKGVPKTKVIQKKATERRAEMRRTTSTV